MIKENRIRVFVDWLLIHTEAGEEDSDYFSIFLFLNDTTASFQHCKDIAWQAEGTHLLNEHTHTHTWQGWVVSLVTNS